MNILFDFLKKRFKSDEDVDQSSIKASASPNPYLKNQQSGNNGNPTEQSVPNVLDYQNLNQSSFVPAYQPSHASSNNISSQSIIPVDSRSDMVFYCDGESQTCTTLQTFITEPKEGHCCIGVMNIVLWITVFGGFLAMLIARASIWILIAISIGPLLIYLCYTLCASPIRAYFADMKPYSQFEKVYQELRQRTGHLVLKAECYHYSGNRDRKKVVSHTATQLIPVKECGDATGGLEQLEDKSRFMFCKFKKYYYFADTKSHTSFQNTFAVFKCLNTKDCYQAFTHTLDIAMPESADELGIGVKSTGGCVNGLYVFFTLIGLGWFYLRIIECLSQRISVNITKRLII